MEGINLEEVMIVNLDKKLNIKDTINEIHIYNKNLELVPINETNKIKNLYTDGKLDVGNNEFTFLNYGIYHQFIDKNYDEAIKYYLMAIKKDNTYAMNNLALIHVFMKNYDEAKKYYLMAIQKGNLFAMNNFGIYYLYIEKNYNEAKKYYLMALEQGNVQAMVNLAHYYYVIENNYKEAKKYCLMALEQGNIQAMINLGQHYYVIEKNYEEAKKYYLMALENDNNNTLIINTLGKVHYEKKNYEEAKKYYLMGVEKESIDSMFELGNYYKLIENEQKQAIKYYMMAYIHSKSEPKIIRDTIIKELKEITTPLELFMLFQDNALEYNEDITPEIQLYINKLKLAKVGICDLCKEKDKKVIMLQCFAHEYCSNCYVKVCDKSCSICKL